MSNLKPCDDCLRRGFTLELLGPFIEVARRRPNRLRDVLALDDGDLLRAVAGQKAASLQATLDQFDPAVASAAASAAGLAAICRHNAAYPKRLLEEATAPRLLYVNAPLARIVELTDRRVPAVAIVGTRRSSMEGNEIATELGRGLAAAGVTVVSGMALGIDSAAHKGALQAGGATVAVLACGPDIPYPPSKAPLFRSIRATGAVVSELPPGARPWRWGFLARNRIIAALAQATIVVEAAERSGSLTTAEFAMELGREVLAVPGSARSWRSAGTNQLIRDGATLVRGPSDVLDAILGVARGPEAWRQAQQLPVAAPADLEDEGVRACWQP